MNVVLAIRIVRALGWQRFKANSIKNLTDFATSWYTHTNAMARQEADTLEIAQEPRLPLPHMRLVLKNRVWGNVYQFSRQDPML